MPEPSRESPARPHLAVITLLIVAMLVFGWRSLSRSPRLYDFRTVYAAARAWGSGENPYDHPTLERIWKSAGGEGLVGGGAIENFPSVYPPTTFAIVWPIALLPAPAACGVWLTILLLLFAAMLFELGRLAELPPTRHILLAAIVLILGPLHSGVQGGNVVVPAVACIVIGLGQLQRSRFHAKAQALPITDQRDALLAHSQCIHLLAGMALLVIATCLKPQLGLPMLAWQLLLRPQPAIAALVSGALLLAASIVPMQVSQVPWLASLRANYQVATGPGGSFDYTAHNRYRDHLLNAQVPVFSLTHDAAVTQAIVSVVIIALVAAVIAHWMKTRRSPADPLLGLAVIAALSLVPVYHRYYDALLLCLPIAYAVRGGRGGVMMLILALPLLLPVGWASSLVQKNLVPRSVVDGVAWNVLVMPFYGWLTLLWACLLVWRWCRSKPPTPCPVD